MRTHVKVENRDVNIVQQLSVVFNRIAAREEYDNFLFEVLFEERE